MSDASEPAVPGIGLTVSNGLAETLAAIQAEIDPGKREEMLTAMVNSYAANEIPLVLALLQSSESSDFTEELSARLLRRWAQCDVHAAAVWAEALPDGALRKRALGGVAAEWADHEPAQAETWARQLPRVTERLEALGSIASAFIRTDPVESIRLVATDLLPDARRDVLLRHAAMEWASQDGKNAAKWAQQIEVGLLREQVIAAVATAWSEREPIPAATFLLAELPVGRTHDDAVIGIVQRWSQQDPAQAADWVKQFPEGELRKTAIDEIANNTPKRSN